MIHRSKRTEMTACQLSADLLTARQLLAGKLIAFKNLSILYEKRVTEWSHLAREPYLAGKTISSVYRMPKTKGVQVLATLLANRNLNL
jgi:hypothetical protein